MRPKVCVVCGDALAIGTRADHRYCGVNCRVRAHHLRRGVGTRQARNDRRVRVLEATIERLKRERDTAPTKVDRVRSAATATPPAASGAPRKAGPQTPTSTPTEDRLRDKLRAARESNAEHAQKIELLEDVIDAQCERIELLSAAQPSVRGQGPPLHDTDQRLSKLERQGEALTTENDRLKAKITTLEAALKRAQETTEQAIQKAKQEAEAAFESERSQNALARQLAEDRARSAEDTLKRDHSLRDTVGNILATALGSKALDLEKQRIAAAMSQPKAATARTDDPCPIAGAQANAEKPPAAAPPPTSPHEPRSPTATQESAEKPPGAAPPLSSARTERAPPADDLAAWEVLRRKALSQRWLPIADTTHGAIRAELRAESEVAQKYTARGQTTTARILASGEEGERQTQIAALQAKWSFIERPPPSWKKPIRWDRGRYRLDIFSELEVAKLAAERRREWERKLRE